jgi:hypothetical protein
MAVYLKSVAVLVALLGVLAGVQFTALVVRDEDFQRAVLMRQRNSGNVLFESEYRVAEAAHVFLIYSAIGCFLTALIGGSLLWGLGALHTKSDGSRAAGTPSV